MVETPFFTAAEILPRYVFLDSLYVGARVLEIGAVDATTGRSARFLKERGASFVLAIEPDAAAVERARLPALAGVDFVAGDYSALHGDPFDLIFLHRAADLVYEPGRLAALIRLLKPNGRLVLALRHPGGLALSDLGAQRGRADPAPEVLIALLKPKFASIEVLSQTALFGYAIGPSPAREVPTSLDESLSEASLPAFDLVIAGPAAVGLETVALTPLAASLVRELVENATRPAAPLDPLGLAGELEGVFVDDRLRELESRTQSALDEAEQVNLQAAQALAERDQLRSVVTTKAKEATSAKENLEKLERDLEALKAERSRLESGSRALMDKLTLEGEALREQLEEARRSTTDHAGLAAKVVEVQSSLDDLQGKLQRAEFTEGDLGQQLKEAQLERDGLVKWLRTAEAQRAEWEERARYADQARESLAAQIREAAHHAADSEGRANAYSQRLAVAEQLLTSQRGAVAELVGQERDRLTKILEATDAQRVALAASLEIAEARARKIAEELSTPLPEIPEIFHSAPTLSVPTLEPTGPDLSARLSEAERERDGLVKWLKAAEAKAAELEERARTAESARDILVEKLREAQRAQPD